MAACLLRSYGLFRSLKKVLLENVRLERAPTLAGDDEQSLADVNLLLKRLDLRGVRRIEHMQLGKPGNRSKGHPQHFRTEAGSSHAEQQHVLESGLFYLFRDVLQLFALRNLFFDDIEPAQPLGFVFARPERGVTLPQTFHFSAGLPLAQGGFHRSGQRLREGGLESAHTCFPFVCVLFDMASSNFVKASANSFTPSSVSLSVTSFIEMPAFARSAMTFWASGKSSV